MGGASWEAGRVLGSSCRIVLGGAIVKRLLNGVWVVGLVLVAVSAAWAQGPQAVPTGYRPGSLLDQVISTLVFSVIGIVLAIGGFKLFDAAIPFSLEREICEKNNIAVAILAAAVILGACLIVGCVVLS